MQFCKVERYFNQSNITKEKVDLIEKKLGFNLSKYKQNFYQNFEKI